MKKYVIYKVILDHYHDQKISRESEKKTDITE